MSTSKETKLNESNLLEKILKEENDFSKEILLSLFEPPKMSPLKSIEQQEIEINKHIEDYLAFKKKDTEEGVNLFINECRENERAHLKEIFTKIESIVKKLEGAEGEVNSVTVEDCEFLNEIANRKLTNQNYQESSCMFRLIIQINCFFDPGWVGWALSEQKLTHLEIVENIYNMALEFFPTNYYIILFATDFYASYNQKTKAIEILKKAKEQLITDGMQSSKSFELIEESLNTLQKTY